MGEALLKFSLQRLKSLVLEENPIFAGLENQVQSLVHLLVEIDGLYDSLGRTTELYYKFESRWFRPMRDTIHSMEDYMDGFILQMENCSGPDQLALTDLCKIEFANLEERLGYILSKMDEHKKEKVQVENDDTKDVSTQPDEGETSAFPPPIKLYHINIPYYLRSCLMYCCVFPEKFPLRKGRLVRLLVAEGLVQERPGEVIEDIAEENIEKLVDHGLLIVVDETKLKVNDKLREFLLGMIEQEDFLFACSSADSDIPLSTRRLSIHSDVKNIPADAANLSIHSLFMFDIGSVSGAEVRCLWQIFLTKKFLRVLDLEGVQIGTVLEELGDLIHLRYLSFKKSSITELPETLSNLRNLQTLDLRWTSIIALLKGILSLRELRHLKMFKNSGVAGVHVPAGIGSSKNLQSLTGLSAGDGIASELGNLTQLRKLGLMELNEDDVNDVCVSITNMKGLLSLSLEPKPSYPVKVLPSIEQLSPPPLLQKLRLEGRLELLPNWFSLMANLKKLRLGFSHLAEDPAIVLQILPSLNHLTLWHAHDGKKIGKEFCRAGGFPKLEFLLIASHVLEEWTELEEGALPSLKYLHMHNCLKLKMLPEGLQHISNLQQLKLIPLLDDHVERLKPDGGTENYKINHIPSISFLPSSTVRELFQGHPAMQGA